MIIDASPMYTDLEVSHAVQNPIVFSRYVHKERNVSLYSQLDFKIHTSSTSFSVTLEKPKLKPTPKRLKEAMFNISSKAISKALSR